MQSQTECPVLCQEFFMKKLWYQHFHLSIWDTSGFVEVKSFDISNITLFQDDLIFPIKLKFDTFYFKIVLLKKSQVI